MYGLSFSSVLWPPFGRLIVCSLCILSICNFNYFPFWSRFNGNIWALFASVPGHCLLFTFVLLNSRCEDT